MFSPIPHATPRRVRRTPIALLVIAVLHGSGVADPGLPELPREWNHAPGATARDTPWLDQGPTPILAIQGSSSSDSGDHKLAASLTLGGLYAAFATWSYFAWYRTAS